MGRVGTDVAREAAELVISDDNFATIAAGIELLLGAIAAFLLHVASMHVPLMQNVLGTEPVPRISWLVVAVLALTVVPAIELHKWSWRIRHPRIANGRSDQRGNDG